MAQRQCGNLDKDPARPVVDEAVAYLQRVVRERQNTGLYTLPSVDDLARSAGVARMSMWRAVKRLCTSGVLRAGRGRRVCVAAHGQPPIVGAPLRATDRSRRSRWRAMSGTIARDIVNGRYAPGSQLPTVKELCRRYGGCYRTLVRSLEDLCDSGYLRASGRGYQLRATSERRRYNPYIVLIAFGDAGRMHLISPRTHDQFRSLEAVCRARELDLVTITGDFAEPLGGSARSWAATLNRVRRYPPLGVVFWTIAFWDERIRTILEFIKQLGVPSAVLVEALNTTGLWQAYASLRMKPFVMAITPTCGRDMGRYLLSLGHRRVARVGGMAESSPRQQGLCAAFEHAGFADGVIDYALRSSSTAPPVNEVEDALRRAPSALAALGHIDERTAAFTSGAIETLLAHAAYTMQRPSGMVEFDRTIDAVLADKSITAIVADDDATAIECLRRLVARGVEIPGRLSVAGFDDSMAALAFGLTTYNFNGEGVARAMLAHILDPQPVVGTTEIPGTVVERRSTGPVRSPRA